MNQEYQTLTHTFLPIYNTDSKILILGSFPSVKSREFGFYYSHPRNRFYQVLAGILNTEVPITIEEKTKFLLHNKIAVWDVINQCDIIGSKDSSIKNVIPSDIEYIVENSHITHIFTNGKTAFHLYQKYLESTISIPVSNLPSTSPANAAFSLEKLITHWKCIKQYL